MQSYHDSADFYNAKPSSIFSSQQELLKKSLLQGDLSTADQLREADVNFDNVQYKDILDIAIDSNSSKVLSWILKHTKTALHKSDKQEFYAHTRKITQFISSLELEYQQSLYLEFQSVWLDYKFHRLGLLDENDMALILAATMSTKEYPNTVFVLLENDLPELRKQIKKIAENDEKKNPLRFQIILYCYAHTLYGQFEIGVEPVVRYFHLDPAVSGVNAFAILPYNFILSINQLTKIEIYSSVIRIHRTSSGCSYYALDGAMMLATPANTTYIENLLECMTHYGKVKNLVDNVKYTESNFLPVRLLRGWQHVGNNDSKENSLSDVHGAIFKTERKNSIVNKKGETAEQSIRNDLREGASNTTPFCNIRIERKMKQFKIKAIDFINKQIQDGKIKHIFDANFSQLLRPYQYSGLESFCEKAMAVKEEKFKLS